MPVSSAAIFIGAGQFGQVYTIENGKEIAFKVVRRQERSETLEDEYHAMITVYRASLTNLLFRVPKPLGLCKFKDDHPPTVSTTGYQTTQQRLTTLFQNLQSTNSTYAMRRIPYLPTQISALLLDKHPVGNLVKSDERITMCRLYFGRTGSVSRFVNTRNFPIDIETYQWLRSKMNIPDPDSVSAEMGRFMAMVHISGYDCRDVEFTLTGSTEDGNCGFHAFDFDQMKPLHGLTRLEKLKLMRESFFLNDPYFPRPRLQDELYCHFKRGYLYTIEDGDLKELALDFFNIIETDL